jgi:hypothetical protein
MLASPLPRWATGATAGAVAFSVGDPQLEIVVLDQLDVSDGRGK